MALAQLLSGLQPTSPIDYGNQQAQIQSQLASQQMQRQQQQAELAMQPLRMQQAQIANQSAQDQMTAARQGRANELVYRISQAPPEARDKLWASLHPSLSQIDPSREFPEQWNDTLGTVYSPVSAKDQLELMRQNRSLDIQQQVADQAKMDVIKDIYGNPVSLYDRKSGDIQPIPGTEPQLPPTDAEGNPLTGDSYVETLPKNIKGIVKAIGEGRMAPYTGIGATKGAGFQIMQAVQQAYPDFNANAFGALKEWNTGKLGNTVRSLNVANDHLDTLYELANALQNNDSRAINSIKNSFKAQFGSELPTDFNAAKQIVGDEVVKAVIGSSGALQDREDMKAQLNQASSWPQLAGAIQTYKTLMRGQLGGLKQQYEVSTGKKDFMNRLSEKTRKEIAGEGQIDRNDPRVKAALDAGYSEQEIMDYLKGKQ